MSSGGSVARKIALFQSDTNFNNLGKLKRKEVIKRKKNGNSVTSFKKIQQSSEIIEYNNSICGDSGYGSSCVTELDEDRKSIKTQQQFQLIEFKDLNIDDDFYEDLSIYDSKNSLLICGTPTRIQLCIPNKVYPKDNIWKKCESVYETVKNNNKNTEELIHQYSILRTKYLSEEEEQEIHLFIKELNYDEENINLGEEEEECIYSEPIYSENNGSTTSYWTPTQSTSSSSSNTEYNNVLFNNTSIQQQHQIKNKSLPPIPSISSYQINENKLSTFAKSTKKKLVKKLNYIRKLSLTSPLDTQLFKYDTNIQQQNHHSTLNVASSIKKYTPIPRPRNPPPEPPKFNSFTTTTKSSIDDDEFQDSDFCDSDSELIKNFVCSVQPIYSMEEEPLYQYYTYGISSLYKEGEQDYIPLNLGLKIEMILPNNGKEGTGGRRLWCGIPEVVNSGILNILSEQQKQYQESIFEILSSEVSYLKSLDVLLQLFYSNTELIQILSDRDRAALFGNIQQVRDASELFLNDLLKKWNDSWYIEEIGSLLIENVEKRFCVYKEYCRNKIYQDSTLFNLRKESIEFNQIILSIEKNPTCEMLGMDSFLLLPMQRITRLPLLVNAILPRCINNNKEKIQLETALQSLKNLVMECNEAARESQDYEESCKIFDKLEFNRGNQSSKSPGSFLLKGEFMKNPFDNNKGKINWTFTKSKSTYFTLILFTQELYITKRKSSGKYEVIDSVSSKQTHIKILPTLEGISKDYTHYFMVHFEGNDNIYLLGGRSESEIERWKNKLEEIRTTVVNEEKVKVIFNYTPQRDDELLLNEGEELKIKSKQPDGWFYGIKNTGEEGWFPGNYVT